MIPSDELRQLVQAHAEEVADLSAEEQEQALRSIHRSNTCAGLLSGLPEAAAIDMADRVDAWIRESMLSTAAATQDSRIVH